MTNATRKVRISKNEKHFSTRLNIAVWIGVQVITSTEATEEQKQPLKGALKNKCSWNSKTQEIIT